MGPTVQIHFYISLSISFIHLKILLHIFKTNNLTSGSMTFRSRYSMILTENIINRRGSYVSDFEGENRTKTKEADE